VSSICGHQFPALPVDAMMMTMMMTMMMGEDKNGVLIPYASNGVLPLTLVACCICIPITQYKAVYVVTVGYGLSIATLGLLLLLLLARSDSCPAATAALSPSSLLPAAALDRVPAGPRGAALAPARRPDEQCDGQYQQWRRIGGPPETDPPCYFLGTAVRVHDDTRLVCGPCKLRANNHHHKQ
jgi:hypothetical protein